jgi:cell division initiation protein
VDVTPSDIRSKTFEQVRRGLDPTQVNDYLSAVARQLERRDTELALAAEALEDARAIERGLRDSIIAASEARDELLAAATEHARDIRAAAHRDADRQRRDAEDEARARIIDARREALELMAKTRRDADALMTSTSREAAALRAQVEQLRAVVHRTENHMKGLASGALGGLSHAHLMLDEAPSSTTAAAMPSDTFQIVVDDASHTEDEVSGPSHGDVATGPRAEPYAEGRSALPAAVDRLLAQLRDIG